MIILSYLCLPLLNVLSNAFKLKLQTFVGQYAVDHFPVPFLFCKCLACVCKLYMFCWPSHYLHAHSYSRTLTHIHTVLHVSPSFPAVFPCSTPHVSLSKVLSALSRHTVVVVVSFWAVMLCLASSVWDFQYGESFGKGCVAPTAHTTRSVSLDLSLSLSRSLSLSLSLSLFTTYIPTPFFLSGFVFSPPLKSLWKQFFSSPFVKQSLEVLLKVFCVIILVCLALKSFFCLSTSHVLYSI